MKAVDRACLTQEIAKSLFDYDPETGVIAWKYHNGRRSKDHAGFVDQCGYRKIKICIDAEAFSVPAHRVVWLYMMGNWPPRQIDHIDGNKLNNKWANLRTATPSQNIANQTHRNPSGFKGVTRMPNGKWVARIRRKGRFTHLGTFNTILDAASAYRVAAREEYGEYARFE